MIKSFETAKIQRSSSVRALKQCCFSQRHKKAGRNSSGSITMFHRGGGSKRLFRRIDFKRNLLSRGVVERIEYDPNRSARIALIRWSDNLYKNKLCEAPNKISSSEYSLSSTNGVNLAIQKQNGLSLAKPTRFYFSYILACEQLQVGDKIRNFHPTNKVTDRNDLNNVRLPQSISVLNTEEFLDEKLVQQAGNCIPLWTIPIGTFLHNIEFHPGKGGQFGRAAGTFAQLVQKYEKERQCVIRLPSGILKQLDSECRATIGIVSNISHNTRKKVKAGQNRWLGKKPTVRGVAMNPIDHPHGGGEGRTKGGRPSVSPWGKPTKGGFKTVLRNKRTARVM